MLTDFWFVFLLLFSKQYYHRIYGSCQKCPSNIPALLGGLAIMLFFGSILGYRMSKKKVDLGIFSIGIDYFQVKRRLPINAWDWTKLYVIGSDSSPSFSSV